MPWAEACELGAQIADAVAHAHAHGVVHRDLKPENVLLVADRMGSLQVKVLDFGIAHVKAQSALAPAAGRPLTVAGAVMGTPGYMPPEQALGQGVDERADLYAIGVMLWELLEGRCPFEGETFSEIVTKQMREPAPELAPVRGPAGLRDLVRALLQRAPAERPASAALVRDTLRDLAQRGQSSSPSALSAGRAGVHAAQTLLSSGSMPRRMRMLSRPRLRAAAAIAVCALLVVLMWSFSGSEDDVEQAERSAVGAEESTRRRSDSDGDQARGDERDAAAKRSAGRTREGHEKADKERPRERLKRAFDGLFK